MVLSESEGRRLAAALGDKKAAILQNHGILTAGPTIEAVAWWYITMEDAARTQLLAEAAGKPDPSLTRSPSLPIRRSARPKAATISFQPLWDWIVREEPDLLD